MMSTPTFIVFRDTGPAGALYGEVDTTELQALVMDAVDGR